MALAFSSSSTSIIRSAFVRRRLPIVGAFCLLSLGIANLTPSLTSSSPLLTNNRFVRSKAPNHHQRLQSVAMASGSSSSLVPTIVVYVTVPNKESGKKLASSIVKEKLAACVNRVPGIESVYEWNGEIQTDSEELLIIKTRESLLNALTDHVKANHEYDVPEVIALPLTNSRRQPPIPGVDQESDKGLITSGLL